MNDYILNQTIYLKYLIDNKDLFVNIQNKNSSTFYNFAWVNKIAFALINYISLEIGGQEIDIIDSNTLNCWYELTTTIDKKNLLDKMIGNIEILTSYNNNLTPSYTLLLPLPFWFCKYKSQAIPCVGLRYHDIIVKLKLNELYKCCYFEPDEYNLYSSNININDIVKIQDMSLLVEYVHLGEDERKKFGSFTNESLIEQHRVIILPNIVNINVSLPLDFVNPVRELIWIVQKTSNIDKLKLWNNYEDIDIFIGIINSISTLQLYSGLIKIEVNKNLINYTDYTNGYIEIYNSKYYNGLFKIMSLTNQFIIINNYNYIYPDSITFKLYINKFKTTNQIIVNENIKIYGTDLISLRDQSYFTTVQNYQHHTYIPIGIHTYSFCLNSELYQPSGTLNFSVIDDKKLYLEFNKNIINQINSNNDSLLITIIARSHNILKIEQGMAKLQFGI